LLFYNACKVKLTTKSKARTNTAAGNPAGQGEQVATILPFLKNDSVFEPEATQAMSAAFEAACQALNLSESADRERAAVAVRIIELARRGERDPVRLSQSVLRDAGSI